MLRRLGVRGKILAVLALPMLVMLFAAVFISAESLRDLRTARANVDVVAAIKGYMPLGAAVEQEAALTLAGGSAEDVAAARKATDDALVAVRPLTGAVDLSQFSDAVVAAFTTSQADFAEKLPAVRTLADTEGTRAVAVQSGYAELIDSQFTVVDGIAQSIADRELASYLSAYLLAARTSHSLITELIDGMAIKTAGQDVPSAGTAFATLVAQTETYRHAATAAIAALAIDDVALSYADPSTLYTRQRTWLGIGTVEVMANLDPVEFAAQVNAQIGRLSTASDGVLTAAGVEAQQASDAQQQRTLLTAGIAILAVVISIIVAFVVSRTIVIPLRRLTAAAADVRDELPRLVEQVSVPGEGPEMTLPHIPVRSSDEVGRLAAAFNAVNDQTIKVAQEQAVLRGSIAEMFVNVARRDQVLLNRQLSFIDTLERTEEDPNTLANLFRLDHLATRMRRNAESLLVLAGIDSGRRLRDALPLSDVVRTASSEIEQYDRVQLDLQADPHMLGFNALPAAHLLAELLENATVFSEPETPVVVTTGVSGDHVLVRIVDQGLGMSDEEIDAANAKISGAAVGEALGAQRLGLYVVGRLAKRLNVDVKLRKSTVNANGTETVVRFPAALFQSSEVAPLAGYGVPVATDATGAYEAPVVEEVDLAALTDGQTGQGLPKRRTDVDAPPATTGAGLPSRSRKTFDEDNLVLPEAPKPTLAPDLQQAAGGDWSPAALAAGSGLPSRQRAQSAGWVKPTAPADTRQAAPADPAARAGMFAGFRGRAGAPVASPAASPSAVPGLADDETAAPAAMAAPAAPPAIVVPGLADDDWVAPSGDAYAEPVAETAAEPAPVDAYDAPVAYAEPQPVAYAEPEPQPEPVAYAEPEPVAYAEPEPQPEPVAYAEPQPEAPAPAHGAPWAAAAGVASWFSASHQAAAHPAAAEPVEVAPAVEQPYAAPSADDRAHADALAEPLTRGWRPPQVDLDQWAPVSEAAAAPAVAPDAPAWPRPEPVAPTSYAPFGRSADEARAWTTGAIPVVDEPSGFQGSTEPVAAEPVAAEAPSGEQAGWSWGAPSWLAEAEPVGGPTAEPMAAEQPAYAEPQPDAFAPVEPVVFELEPDAAQPTMAFQPFVEPDVEPEPVAAAAPVVETPAPEQLWRQAPKHPEPAAASPRAGDAESRPAWAPTGMSAAAPAESFSSLIAPEAPAKKRRGLFGRRKNEPSQTPVPVEPAASSPAPAAAPAAFAPEQAAPVRASAWTAAAQAPAPAPAPVAPTWQPQTSWSGPPAAPAYSGPTSGLSAPAPAPAFPSVEAPAFGAPQFVEPEPVTAYAPEPAAPEQALPARQPAASQAPAWTAPSASEWTPRVVPSPSRAPQSAPTPVVAPRVGTLDDEVAAMLALRSDIQEQALSELSQLSAYRPQVVAGSSSAERLTKRVPTAIPEAPQFAEPTKGGGDRDADKLRSRLSSFQSGTARGRRDADNEAGAS